ncbi:MAG TPA: MFS transporter [Xanthobacteraceae bacterium]|nr:MFS transporter [Xanthobacteraceae bacterium]
MSSPATADPSATAKSADWRSPMVIVLGGCLIAMLAFGPRSALGFFLTPLSSANGWGRDVFALAIATQSLLYGAAQPFAGALADRFGSQRVIVAGALLYALGIFLMAQASSPAVLYLSAGVLVGFGLSGCSFNLVITSVAKVVPESWRSMVFGAGTAAGSFGQFLYSPLGVALIDAYGWRAALEVFTGLLLLIIPLALIVAPPRPAPSRAGVAGSSHAVPAQTYRQALAEALAHRSYVLLVLGFFTCGFQLGFVTVHLPSYLIDRGLSAQVGGWTLGLIGLFNIIGAMTSGWLGSRVPKRYILSCIYFSRALAVIGLVTLPASPLVALIYGAVTGLLWLSSVPPTSGLVAVMFGTRWLAMLFGIAFFSHQVGGFLGVYLGGVIYERTGSYDIVWWLGVLFGVISAIINLPIVEKPVARLAATTA